MRRMISAKVTAVLTTMSSAMFSAIVTTIFTTLLLLQPNDTMAEWSDSINQAWENTKKTTQQLLHEGSSITQQVIQSYAQDSDKSASERQNLRAQRLQEIWQGLLDKLNHGLATRQKIAQAPSFVLWGEDKDSISKKYREIMDDVLIVLEDPAIENRRQRIKTLKDKIETLKTDISVLKEQRVVAPEQHKFQTTKTEINQKIADKKNQISAYQLEIKGLIEEFRLTLRDMGVHLESNQLEMLLVRVDADDIIQMLAVLDLLKDINQQLSQLLNESDEDLTRARRYYGMHLVLLEMLSHMQSTYLLHIDEIYVPRLENIKNKTLRVQQYSKDKMKNDSDPKRSRIYQQNIKAQQLTLKIIKIYVEQLTQQKNKILIAQKNLKKDIDLAQNTYNTVILSAELSHILQSSIEAFNSLQKIQIPEIIPFENIQMQKKYAELSKAVKNG